METQFTRKNIIYTLVCLLLSGCANYQQTVQQYLLQQRVVLGTAYKHRIYINQAGGKAQSPQHWHVYIEGDGQAVNRFGKPNIDPTPQHPMLLAVMAKDPMPAIYLGRPCYYHTDDPACTPAQWTLSRYSPKILDSMVNALGSMLNPQDTVTLIGHSGGATLAVLMASRINATRQVVTLAGNLQVKRWIRYHGYSPLPGSLDPSEQAPLSPCIRQYHLAGGEDPEILWSWIADFAATQPRAEFILIAAADHNRHWPLWWQKISSPPTFWQDDCAKVTFIQQPTPV